MTTADPTPHPAISLIVNTLDRADQLATLLAALEHQSYPTFEVIVVVGPTRDHTLDVLAAYAERVRVLHCPDANLSRSRNLGLLAARGELVAFTDDDAVPCRTWLAQLAALLADPTVAATGGSVYLVHPAQPAIQHRLGMVSNLGEQGNVRSARHEPLPDGLGKVWTERPMGANMAFRRDALLAVGGFDEFYEWLYDDTDVALRLALSGRTVRLTPAAPVYHVPASSRNRIVRTFTGRWWIGAKAAAYFAVQNGIAARQPDRHILLRLLRLLNDEWLLSRQLRRDGKISAADHWTRCLRSSLATLQGALHGLGTRRLLPIAAPPAAEPFRPFLAADSDARPFVDPVTGLLLGGPGGGTVHRRVAVIASEGSAAVAAHLTHAGAEVHVLLPGGEQITCQDGAYHHRIPWNDLPRQLERVIANDDIDLVIANPAHLDQLRLAGLPLQKLGSAEFPAASPLQAAQVVG